MSLFRLLSAARLTNRVKNPSNFLHTALQKGWVALALVCISLSSLVVQAQPLEDVDPLEGINRDIYAFNMTADKYVLKPVARAYQWVMPDIAERAVERVFDNLEEVGSAVNNLAQGKGYSAANNSARFVVNSTLGIAGLMDVAVHMGLEKNEFEDFGQTMAVWGVGSGPYLMIPFIGPTTLRDGPGMLVDSRLEPQYYLEDRGAVNAARVTDVISIRAKYMDADRALPDKDPYSFVRDAYFQRREYLIKDGQVVDEFGAEGSDDFLD